MKRVALSEVKDDLSRYLRLRDETITVNDVLTGNLSGAPRWTIREPDDRTHPRVWAKVNT